MGRVHEMFRHYYTCNGCYCSSDHFLTRRTTVGVVLVIRKFPLAQNLVF